jgi:hypothetical protein
MWKQNQILRPPATWFEDLIVWQKAHEFALMAYQFYQAFPRTEVYGLTSQFRRAEELDSKLQEVSKLLTAYGRAIANSVF